MIGTEYIIKYLSDTKSAVVGAKELETLNSQIAKTIGSNYANATKIIGTDLKKISTQKIQIDGKDAVREVQQLGTVAQFTDGSFQKFAQTQTLINGKVVSTKGSLADVTNQFRQTNLEVAKGDKFFSQLGNNIKQLAARAILTIPIWLALRAAVTGTLSAISGSFQNLLTTSLALQKAKVNLQGTVQEISAQFERLKTDTRNLALETGISQEKIIAAFQKFATVGFDYETAMAGATNATKLSVVLQGDAIETANAFARSMRVLIDRSKEAKPASEQMADAMGLTLELWRTNAFELNELTEGLEKFAGTARTMNMTTAQTITLLATLGTAGLRGSQAGTLLRTSIQKLVENLDKLAGAVGVKFNKEMDSAYDVLLRVIEQIDILNQTSKLAPEATEAIAEIFGGVRGGQPIRALVALREELLKNIELLPDLGKFGDSFKEAQGVLGTVVARLRTTNAEIGKAFLTGLLGADEFNEALEKVVKKLQEIQENAEGFGRVIQGTFNIAKGIENIIEAQPLNIRIKIDPGLTQQFQDQISLALKGALPKKQTAVLFSELLEAQTLGIDLGIDPGLINSTIQAIRQQLLALQEVNKAKKETTLETEKQRKQEEQLEKVFLNKEDYLRFEQAARKELSALGLTEIEIESRMLDLRTKRDQFTEKDIKLQQELIEHLSRLEEIELSRSRSKGLVDNQLEILRLQGATNVQLVQQRIELERLYGINQSRADLLRNELELQKEITKEQLDQNKLSSDSVKLFEIAQKYGIQAVTPIADLLAGKLDITSFRPGAKFSNLMPVVEEFFPALLKQLQAVKFFFEGAGRFLQIPEKRAIQEFKPLPVSQITIPPIKTEIGNINVEIKKIFKEEDMANQIIESMLEAIRNNTLITNAINEKIDEF